MNEAEPLPVLLSRLKTFVSHAERILSDVSARLSLPSSLQSKPAASATQPSSPFMRCSINPSHRLPFSSLQRHEHACALLARGMDPCCSSPDPPTNNSFFYEQAPSVVLSVDDPTAAGGRDMLAGVPSFLMDCADAIFWSSKHSLLHKGEAQSTKPSIPSGLNLWSALEEVELWTTFPTQYSLEAAKVISITIELTETELARLAHSHALPLSVLSPVTVLLRLLIVAAAKEAASTVASMERKKCVIEIEGSEKEKEVLETEDAVNNVDELREEAVSCPVLTQGAAWLSNQLVPTVGEKQAPNLLLHIVKKIIQFAGLRGLRERPNIATCNKSTSTAPILISDSSKEACLLKTTAGPLPLEHQVQDEMAALEGKTEELKAEPSKVKERLFGTEELIGSKKTGVQVLKESLEQIRLFTATKRTSSMACASPASRAAEHAALVAEAERIRASREFKDVSTHSSLPTAGGVQGPREKSALELAAAERDFRRRSIRYRSTANKKDPKQVMRNLIESYMKALVEVDPEIHESADGEYEDGSKKQQVVGQGDNKMDALNNWKDKNVQSYGRRGFDDKGRRHSGLGAVRGMHSSSEDVGKHLEQRGRRTMHESGRGEDRGDRSGRESFGYEKKQRRNMEDNKISQLSEISPDTRSFRGDRKGEKDESDKGVSERDIHRPERGDDHRRKRSHRRVGSSERRRSDTQTEESKGDGSSSWDRQRELRKEGRRNEKEKNPTTDRWMGTNEERDIEREWGSKEQGDRQAVGHQEGKRQRKERERN